MVFAQTANDVAPWAQLVVNLGLATWLVVYLLTKWIPNRDKQHADTIEKILATHERLVKEERDKCDARHAEMMAKADVRHEESMARWEKNHELLRDVNHGVRDVLQDRANEKAHNELTRKQRGSPGRAEP